MQLGEEVANRPVLKVNGRTLPDDVHALLVHAYVEDGNNAPSMFVLRFTDSDTAVLDKHGFKIAAKVELSVKSSGATQETLMKGDVTALEAEVTHDGVDTVVRGFDRSHRLFRGRQVTTFVKCTSSDIFRKVVQSAGLALGEIDATTHQHEHVTQDAVSDWDFLSRLAELENRRITMTDDKINFRKPPEAASAPGGSAGSRQNPLVIERDTNVIALRATVTSADQVPQVQVRGWDPAAKRAAVGTARAKTASARLAASDPKRLAGLFPTGTHVVPRPGLHHQATCAALAESTSDRLSGGFAELEGTVVGNAKLRAGTAVRLDGMGGGFDGDYTLSATRHDFSPDDGYQTSFTVSNRSERSLFGLGSTGKRDSRGEPRLMPAVVTNNKDPEGLGRVKVKFPTISDTHESGWARTVYPGAGAERGLVCVPEVGDEVLVATGDGIDDVYVIGGLYNGEDKPRAPEHTGGNVGSVKRRSWSSRKGMVVEFVDDQGKEKLEISTNDGQQRVTLLQSTKGIELVSEGPVSVTAKQDVSVKTTTGNVSVSSTSGNVSMAGTNVTIEAKGALELKGATVKVAGQGKAELSATGITTVRGSMVNIN